MKRKIKITGFDGKVVEGEVIIPNKDHLAAQQKYRTTIFKPKKGRGSYKRNKKTIYEEE